MKNIVIYGYNLEMGGAERALINLLNLIHDKCQVDLILLEKKGVLLKEIPNDVNVIEIKTNVIKYFFFRFCSIYRKILINNLTRKKYDIAIAFMEGRAATFVADMNQKCKKIAWIHNDVNSFDIGISTKEIKKSYSKVDRIIAVSKVSQKSFCSKYGFTSAKVSVIYNMIDEEKILKLSNEKNVKKNKYTFINVAKMRPQKRHDRLVNVVKRLIEDGYDFELWLIGNGPLEVDVLKQIETYKLNDTIKTFGLLENPYPYVKCADCFVMSSDHEGYPLSLLESLLLKTKVITTNVSGASEILEDGKYGIIVDISEKGLYDAMKYVLENKDDKTIDNNLKKYCGNSKNIVKQLLELCEIEL